MPVSIFRQMSPFYVLHISSIYSTFHYTRHASSQAQVLYTGDIAMKLRLLFILVLFLLPLTGAEAATYTWTDSLTVTTTAFDTTFSTARWASCSLWAVDCDVRIRFGTTPSDTVSWSDKSWVELKEGQVMNFVPYEPYFHNSLLRLQAKAVSGSGTVYISGLKTKYQ